MHCSCHMQYLAFDLLSIPVGIKKYKVFAMSPINLPVHVNEFTVMLLISIPSHVNPVPILRRLPDNMTALVDL